MNYPIVHFSCENVLVENFINYVGYVIVLQKNAYFIYVLVIYFIYVFIHILYIYVLVIYFIYVFIVRRYILKLLIAICT